MEDTSESFESETADLKISDSPDVNEGSEISSKSTTPNSSSTYEYSHEAFTTFQHKVVTLLVEIGATGIEDIERLQGGSFNRIVAATIQWPDEINQKHDLKVVLRIPRFSEPDEPPSEDVMNQTAILKFLSSSGLSAPRVLAFDATSNNAISSPFTLQTRLPGTSLDLCYSNMSLQDRLGIADELVDVLVRLDGIRFSGFGRLRCAARTMITTDKLPILPKSSSETLSESVEVYGFGASFGSADDRVDTPVVVASIYDLFLGQLNSWIALEQSTGLKSFRIDLFERLKVICAEMKDAGLFCDEQEDHEKDYGILYHWDLEPRNILVEQDIASSDDVRDDDDKKGKKTKSWHITGIIDWDEALVVPPILVRKPPVWLWDFSDDDTYSSSILRDYDGDVDLLPLDLYDDDDGKGGRISEVDRKVKAHFEMAIAERLYRGSETGAVAAAAAYHDDAYGRGRWLRRLWRFALDGFSEDRHIDRLNKLERDWRAYKDEIAAAITKC